MSLKAFNKKKKRKYTVNVVYIANIEKYEVLPLLVVVRDLNKCLCVCACGSSFCWVFLFLVWFCFLN